MSVCDQPDWLPDLILLDDFSGSWVRYENEVYAIFYRDFIESKPSFQGAPVRVAKSLIDGKERTFWHCVQEGDVEEKRTPDFRRCERIAWILAVIEHAGDPAVKQWSNHRGRSVRWLLWLEAAEYLVVLEKRQTHWMLLTAYCTSREHTKRKLRREYEARMK